MPATSRDADVIVIGSGAGGLATAAYLAALGRHVVVVERSSMPGGNTAAFTHDGYEFDIGLHYLGSSARSRPALRALLEPLGIDLAFREQDPDGFDVLLFEDMTFAVPRGVEAFRARLHEAFGAERGAIDRFLARTVAIGTELESAPPARPADVPAYAWGVRHVLASARTTLGRELDRLDCSPRLRAVLSWLHGTYALPPGRASLAIHAAVTMHYLGGSFYPEGGANAVSGALVDALRRHGGELLLDTEVTRILVGDGAARGVRLAPGPRGTAPAADELRAPVVVSAMDLKRTFLDLLAPGDVPGTLRRRVRGYELPAPLFIVYAVLDRDLAAEGYGNRNWHVVDCDDLDGYYAALERGQLPAQTWTWVTSASLKDPGNRRLCRPGQTNVQLMCATTASREFWHVGPDLRPRPGYEERKRQLRDRVVAAAERAIPGIGESIVHEEAATPATLERFLGSSGGTAYGIACTPRQFLAGRPAPATRIPGLFLAGASTRRGHGITGVIAGGIETAGAVAGTPAVRAVRAAAATAPAGRAPGPV
ncbi:MAG TPA: NAD(P)/FAD-dependent oxidoreductase, partial [Solirubrobacteraceae bacterium]|nr:NAD(P)/FAD-dependent oxidoreductase [Solirubrobacteraceae bacterium]